jgi:hypothetical protein
MEIRMRIWATVTCLVLLTGPSDAQISPRELTRAGLIDCMREAIGTSSVEDNGAFITLSCSAAKAKTLFNFLGRKVPIDVVQDKNGKFENRQFGNNACYHRIEDPGGLPADDFRCDLILAIGEVLGD